MELKDYQQTVLDTLTVYLDTLKTQQTRANKIKQANAQETDLDLIRPVPDYPQEAWASLRQAGKLPPARKNIPFSLRVDGIGQSVPSVCFKIPTGAVKPFWQLSRYLKSIANGCNVIMALCCESCRMSRFTRKQ